MFLTPFPDFRPETSSSLVDALRFPSLAFSLATTRTVDTSVHHRAFRYTPRQVPCTPWDWEILRSPPHRHPAQTSISRKASSAPASTATSPRPSGGPSTMEHNATGYRQKPKLRSCVTCTHMTPCTCARLRASSKLSLPLYLQPIVWAHLLQRLLPFTLESGLIPLFLMIPSFYWHGDYRPPPLFLGNDKEIHSISEEDHHAVSLRMAVSTHLYPDIVDALLECSTHAEDSVFHPDPATDEFPAPQDPRLCSLTGSPSIPKTAIPDPSMNTFFGIHRNLRGCQRDS
ncbi:hypothetical protein EDD18DRAFT_1355538 [Armillaria luteobubalina]|uniref:Uncharacterized protein n=1 Tax=Armillaria luteobubalina TaxID=153913 RepID=A0AA39Q223_9AGAR|nr:hypothetical protein EDD18DRAFT_1355538 [Armillaria luteobubalina]